MIARIKGKIVDKSTSHLIVDVNNIGYQVSIPLSTYYEIKENDPEVSLHIYTHVREDALTLFGFLTYEEKQLFELMIGVSSIGPKLAIAILSGISALEFATAITNNDKVRLTAIPGVGKKTAERMILELKDKIGKLNINVSKNNASNLNLPDGLINDAKSALTNLGYSKNAIDKAISKLNINNIDNLTFEELVKISLKELSNA